MKQSVIRIIPISIVALVFAVGNRPAVAQSADDDEIQQTVARVSYLAGDVSYSRGDDPDNWQAAAINVAFTLGDRVYAPAGGRAELEVHGGSVIDLSEGTGLSALNLSEDVEQFSLSSGTASFRVRRMEDGDSFEVDTPNVAVSFQRNGLYRIDVDQDGNTTLDVRRGQASIAAGGGQVNVDSGQRIRIDGTDQPRYDVGNLPPPDAWDSWVDQRQAKVRRLESYQYVNSEVAGLNDLDAYGSWTDVPQYGHVWAPTTVEAGWQPYQLGSWVWQDPWGWTWVSTESWGWAPYHYGRWVVSSSRWYWVPEARDAPARYAPALVAFVGGGPGWRGSVSGSGGYVGWFPLAPADPFVPWWGRRREVNVTDVPNVTYVNRRYVTVVNNDTFVSGRGVARGIVRDPAVTRQILSAPVVRGPLPVMPTSASLRVTERAATNRPPAPSVIRPVVTRMAPPPGPLKFRDKLDAIRQAGGMPVSSNTSARLSSRSPAGTGATVPVRPVVPQNGGVALTPRSPVAGTPQPVPLVNQPSSSRPPRASRPPTELGHDAPTPWPARDRPAQDKPNADNKDKKKDVREKNQGKKDKTNVDAKDKNQEKEKDKDRDKNPG